MSRIIIITGASSGYGKAMAKAFKDSGDTVIMTARNEKKLEEARNEVGGDLAIPMDVTIPADWEKLYKEVSEKYGRVDILINNAGGGVAIKDTADQSIEDIDKTIKLNLNSVIYGSKTFAPLFMEQKSGTIINISSICATQCWPQWSVYASAKAGVLNFSKGLYLELKPYNVRVTCIIPASASTNFQSAAGIGEVNDLLTADDVAQAVKSVCDLPSHVVVEDITVYGIDKEINPL